MRRFNTDALIEKDTIQEIKTEIPDSEHYVVFGDFSTGKEVVVLHVIGNKCKIARSTVLPVRLFLDSLSAYARLYAFMMGNGLEDM